jgi:hypothetical protein
VGTTRHEELRVPGAEDADHHRLDDGEREQ